MINERLCIGCGKCVADCVEKALMLENGKARPCGACISCGHCLAICPTGAALLPDLDRSEVRPTPPGRTALDYGALLEALRFRRSMRHFRPAPIDHDTMARIAEVVRYTASGMNAQALRLTFMQSDLPELRTRLYERLATMQREGVLVGDYDYYNGFWRIITAGCAIPSSSMRPASSS